MKNAIKISITILEKELQVVDSDFTDQYNIDPPQSSFT